jgi:hypothetical protein
MDAVRGTGLVNFGPGAQSGFFQPTGAVNSRSNIVGGVCDAVSEKDSATMMRANFDKLGIHTAINLETHLEQGVV